MILEMQWAIAINTQVSPPNLDLFGSFGDQIQFPRLALNERWRLTPTHWRPLYARHPLRNRPAVSCTGDASRWPQSFATAQKIQVWGWHLSVYSNIPNSSPIFLYTDPHPLTHYLLSQHNESLCVCAQPHSSVKNHIWWVRLSFSDNSSEGI